MNDNTILRIKVPAHLYESVKEQLTINEAKKSKHHYGAGMEVVKEKKLPKDGMKKVEEVDRVEETNQIQEKDKEMEKKHRSLDELKAAKEKLEKKINEMEKSSKEVVKEEGQIEEMVTGAEADILNVVAALAATAGVGLGAYWRMITKKAGEKEAELQGKSPEEIKQAGQEALQDLSGNLKSITGK